ncbi:hypothetical protein HAX54_033368 [Datura stramonium]|uniref:Uncharacterized protein n=1 Tax=Datura stramonium TaxID=4076 RepID=A0ABS8VC79_DATST|nr:hypothetical protein [Datura stramonium]
MVFEKKGVGHPYTNWLGTGAVLLMSPRQGETSRLSRAVPAMFHSVLHSRMEKGGVWSARSLTSRSVELRRGEHCRTVHGKTFTDLRVCVVFVGTICAREGTPERRVAVGRAAWEVIEWFEKKELAIPTQTGWELEPFSMRRGRAKPVGVPVRKAGLRGEGAVQGVRKCRNPPL